MKSAISEELQKLAAEAQSLVLEREACQKRILDIQARLTQITGAIVALKNIDEQYNIQEQNTEDDNEVSST
jgi:prefoldin subunit 5